MALKLSDATIGHLAKLLQLALLTGTDVVDHLRYMEVEDDGTGMLRPTVAYEEIFATQLEQLVSDVDTLTAEILAATEGEERISFNTVGDC